MHTGQISSCVIAASVSILPSAPPSAALANWYGFHRSAPPRVEGLRQMEMETERKTRPVTQLDAHAACGSMGYAACMRGGARFAGGLRLYMCVSLAARAQQLYVCGAARRRCDWLPPCCSTSRRLSSEIRSWASVPPPPPTHTLSFCLLAPSFIYLCMVAHVSVLSPSTDSFIFPMFCLHEEECQARASACIPLLCDRISFLHIFSSVSPLCCSLLAHILDQIMRHIMGLMCLMACIKVGELRDG